MNEKSCLTQSTPRAITTLNACLFPLYFCWCHNRKKEILFWKGKSFWQSQSSSAATRRPTCVTPSHMLNWSPSASGSARGLGKKCTCLCSCVYACVRYVYRMLTDVYLWKMVICAKVVWDHHEALTLCKNEYLKTHKLVPWPGGCTDTLWWVVQFVNTLFIGALLWVLHESLTMLEDLCNYDTNNTNNCIVFNTSSAN